MNAKGRGANIFSTIKLTHKGTLWLLTAKLKGDWDTTWQNYGLTNATVAAMPITVPVLSLSGTESPESFFMDKSLLYTVKAGKSGAGR